MALIAVTGGAGFIGSHLVEWLLALGHELLVVDDLSSGSLANLAGIEGRIECQELDVRRRASLVKLFRSRRPDAVAHLAAVASVPRSIVAPALVHDVNLNGTLAALEASRQAGVRRFVLASSAAVYGTEPQLPSHEGDEMAPASPYAAQKAAAELLGQAYRATWGIETVALRLFNVFGERQVATSSYSGVISVFASQLGRLEQATITGDGSQTRDFIYVGDVAAALTAALLGPDPGIEPINVARGESLSVRALYRMLAGLLGVRDEPRFAPARPGDIEHSRASIERLRATLGVTPQVSLLDGLARLIAWQRRTPA